MSSRARPEHTPSGSRAQGPASTRDRAFTGFFSLVVTAMGCAVAALAVPRAIEPRNLPALVLDPRLSEEALDADHELAGKPTSFPHAEELKDLYLAHGASELDATARYDADRLRRLAFFGGELKDGERNLLRAQATERAMAYLLEGSEGPEPAGLLGSFSASLKINGLLSEEGRMRAPLMSVRAAYKARWNLIHGRPQEEGLRPIELQALEGFKALHASRLPTQERADAARKFYEAGGKRGAEIYGVFLFQGGATEDGADLLERAYVQRGELRTRNMLLYAF